MSADLRDLIANLPVAKRTILADLLRPAAEPIAVVGMACRYPGNVDSAQSYWHLLEQGVDAVTHVPPTRWDVDAYYDADAQTPGKTPSRCGAFLSNVDEFDAAFFGISAREAARMDPQQRLLLEVCWDALDHAGVPADDLATSRTGVYVGLTGSDYWWLQVGDPEQFDGHATFGGSHSIAAGRIAYLLDLRGPCLAVDTACSSSLAAIHLACQGLRTGECDMALTGGANVIVHPLLTVGLSRWGLMSPDGRCKTFDAAADGIVRGEGCGVVVLKRYADAVADGDRVLGLIRGSAMNQDGHGTRLSAPNGLAQQAVLRLALKNAGVEPEMISYIEAHGTGTLLGDPIEMEALSAVYGAPRPDGQVCAIGSVKTNMGHLEATAGVAGLMKAVLCLQHRTIPPHLHFSELNPRIHIEDTPFVIPTELTPWPAQEGHRLAAVSAFGLSGTNVHMILEEAPARVSKPSPPHTDQPFLLPISARSEDALRDLVQDYQKMLSNGEPNGTLDLGKLCRTAGTRRTHHPYRLAAVAASREQLAERLEMTLQKHPARDEKQSAAAGQPSGVVFVFCGQGSQWPGMGKGLLDSEPVFLEAVRQCDVHLQKLAGWSLMDALRADEGSSRLNETEVAQPAIFAVQIGLAALYRKWGISPDAVIGHSSGEVAAAYVAGALTLQDAVRLIYQRGRIMQQATGKGRMVAVGISAEEAEQAISGHSGRLSIAAINGPSSVVLSGEPEALRAVLDSLEPRQVFSKDLGVDYAFHSPQMEGLGDEFAQSIRDLQPRDATVTIASTITGLAQNGGTFTPEHWAKGIRNPVRFADAVKSMVDRDYDVYLEIGPRPVLSSPLFQCLKGSRAGTILSSLRPDKDPHTTLLTSVGALYALGVDIDWKTGYGESPFDAELPAYPWQRKPYWLQTCPDHESAPGPTATSDLEARRELVSEFYDAFADSGDTEGRDQLLTFPPFHQRMAGFSWLLAAHDPDNHPDDAQRMRDAQMEMRNVLFHGIDFASLNAVLDFGCGYGSDVLRFAADHPHLKLEGYTVSPRQAEIGNRKVQARNLQDRVAIYNRDSSTDEFPNQYDMVFGLEVSPYIQEKHKLFSNIDRHLTDGGFIQLADFLAHTEEEIGHDETSSYIINIDQWTELLSAYKLRVIECIDMSREASNFLFDPNAAENMRLLQERLHDGGHIYKHFGSYENLGRLLTRHLASYLLLSIQKDPDLTQEEVARVNREQLASPEPYLEAVKRLDDQPAAAAPAAVHADWLYEIGWHARDRRPPPDASPAGDSWLVLADDGGVGQAIADQVGAQGGSCVLASLGADYDDSEANRYVLRAGCPEDVQRMVSTAFPALGPGCGQVVHLWGLDMTPPDDTTDRTLEADQDSACGSIVNLVRGLIGAAGVGSPSLWIGTRGAQRVDGDAEVAIAQAMLWGLGRTVSSECSELWGGLIDLDPSTAPDEVAEQLMAEIAGSDGEDQVAYRQGRRFVGRLRPLTRRASRWAALPLHSDGRYLITGGLGDLGLEVAKWMVDHGAVHLALLQRSALPPEDQWGRLPDDGREAKQVAAVRALEAKGASVRVLAVDVGDGEQLAGGLQELKNGDGLPIRGVVHAAGAAEGQSLQELDKGALHRVLRPKVSGSWDLHMAMRDEPLDFFVLFSSAASVLPSPFLGAYAAGNAFLDALAQYRHAHGQSAVSINWGMWAEVGMAARSQQATDRDLTPRGMDAMTTAEGLAALEHILATDVAQVAVFPMNWSRSGHDGVRFLADVLGEDIPAAAPVDRPAPPAPDGQLRIRLITAPPAEREHLLHGYLAETTATVMEVTVAELDFRRPLHSFGLDSLIAVELTNRLRADLGVKVEVVELLEGCSLTNLTELVSSRLNTGAAEVNADRVSEVMNQLDGMTDEEVRALLAEKKKAVGKSAGGEAL